MSNIFQITEEAATRGVLQEKVFLEILHNPQVCFPVNFAKFLKATFLQNISGRLLLKLKNCNN